MSAVEGSDFLGAESAAAAPYYFPGGEVLLLARRWRADPLDAAVRGGGSLEWYKDSTAPYYRAALRLNAGGARKWPEAAPLTHEVAVEYEDYIGLAEVIEACELLASRWCDQLPMAKQSEAYWTAYADCILAREWAGGGDCGGEFVISPDAFFERFSKWSRAATRSQSSK